MTVLTRLGEALDRRLALRGAWARVLRRLFPTHWSFLLGEIALFSFVGLVASGVYLTLFYRPGVAAVVYHGSCATLVGRPLPEAFESVVALSMDVPFGLVVRRFHHFAAHIFIASLLLHAARVYFTGAFRRPRDLTWWTGLALFALALVSGFTGYCLPFDMRGGTALRMAVTTLGAVPWAGGWLAALALGAPFPGPFILARLFIVHVLLGPALIALLVGAHLALVVRLTHTDYPGPGRDDRREVGAPLWPEQTARSIALLLLVFGVIAFLSAVYPVEAVQAYGPFQTASSYAPLSPDWFLLWTEGAFRLVPRQLDFHLLGARWTNPFYGAVVLPLLVFGACAAYPWLDRRLYGEGKAHILERWSDRPLRTAIGVGGIGFLVLLSLGSLDDRMAGALGTEIWQVDLVWGIVTLVVPWLSFGCAFVVARRTRRRTA